MERHNIQFEHQLGRHLRGHFLLDGLRHFFIDSSPNHHFDDCGELGWSDVLVAHNAQRCIASEPGDGRWHRRRVLFPFGTYIRNLYADFED